MFCRGPGVVKKAPRKERGGATGGWGSEAALPGVRTSECRPAAARKTDVEGSARAGRFVCKEGDGAGRMDGGKRRGGRAAVATPALCATTAAQFRLRIDKGQGGKPSLKGACRTSGGEEAAHT